MFILIRISFVRFIGDFGNGWIIRIIGKDIVKIIKIIVDYIIRLGWCCLRNFGIKLC